MPDQMTRADSLRVYNTGASTDGGAQANADASLGDYRSANEVSHLSGVRNSAIANITVDFIAGANGVGTGTLAATGSNDLKWTPPGGTQGAAVTIANGETKIVEGGGTGESKKYLRVTRTSASALSGTETIDLTLVANNVIGFDNVSSAEAAAGDNEYRAYAMKNVSSIAIASLTLYLATLGTQRTSDTAQLSSSGAGSVGATGSLADWPASGWCRITTSGGTLREIVYYSSRTDNALTVPANGRGRLGTSAAAGGATDSIVAVPGLRIGKETPGSQPTGNIQTIANEGTAPTGITWNTGITAATGVSIGTLAAGNWHGMWIHREIPVGAVAAASVLDKIISEFDAA